MIVMNNFNPQTIFNAMFDLLKPIVSTAAATKTRITFISSIV